MAKKSAKKSPKQFVIDLATDPEKLGNFILDPEAVMDEAKISEEEREPIKNAIALFVSGSLVNPKQSPETYIVWHVVI